MSIRRTPANKEATKSLPHDEGREKGQPYTRETEEYAGGAVVRPPEQQTGKGEKPEASRRR